MHFYKSSILFNILEYSTIYDILNIYVSNIHSYYIISNSKLYNMIIDTKLRYLKKQIISNSITITSLFNGIQNSCPHLHLLNNITPSKLYITPPVYCRQCVICESKIVQSKNAYYNRNETNWQYYLRNENIQHELILRQDINQKPNIMNVMTVNLNNYYNNPANRYSFIRLSIIHKLNSIQALILTYCDTKSLLLNRSWVQFLKRNKEGIITFSKNRAEIDKNLFNNELLNYKINSLKKKRKCEHVYDSYLDMKYCTICKKIECNNNDKQIEKRIRLM